MVSLPSEIYRQILLEADINVLQAFALTQKNLSYDFNFWHDKFKHDDLLFMGYLPNSFREWKKNIVKLIIVKP